MTATTSWNAARDKIIVVVGASRLDDEFRSRRLMSVYNVFLNTHTPTASTLDGASRRGQAE